LVVGANKYALLIHHLGLRLIVPFELVRQVCISHAIELARKLLHIIEMLCPAAFWSLGRSFTEDFGANSDASHDRIEHAIGFSAVQ
jgi:hypothetical protein